MNFSHVTIPGNGELRAVIETDRGDIIVRLFEQQAPNTVRNFVGLATGQIEWTDPETGERTQRPLYPGTIFHRVIPGFMVQCGDPLGNGIGGPGYEFRDEFHRGLRHGKAGTLSMANAGPHTNGSQFFITDAPTPHLDGRHTIFGEVIHGLEVVKEIAKAPRGRDDRPRDDIYIRDVQIFRG